MKKKFRIKEFTEFNSAFTPTKKFVAWMDEQRGIEASKSAATIKRLETLRKNK